MGFQAFKFDNWSQSFKYLMRNPLKAEYRKKIWSIKPAIGHKNWFRLNRIIVGIVCNKNKLFFHLVGVVIFVSILKTKFYFFCLFVSLFLFVHDHKWKMWIKMTAFAETLPTFILFNIFSFRVNWKSLLRTKNEHEVLFILHRRVLLSEGSHWLSVYVYLVL